MTLEELRAVIDQSEGWALHALFRWSDANGEYYWLRMARDILHTKGATREEKEYIYDRLKRIQRIGNDDQRAEIEMALRDISEVDTQQMPAADRRGYRDFIETLHLVENSYLAKKSEETGMRVAAVLTDNDYDYSRRVGRREEGENDEADSTDRIHAETRTVLKMAASIGKRGAVAGTILYTGDMCCLHYLKTAPSTTAPDGRSVSYTVLENGYQGCLKRSAKLLPPGSKIVHTYAGMAEILDANHEMRTVEHFRQSIENKDGTRAELWPEDYYRLRLDDNSWLFYEQNGGKEVGRDFAYPRELHIHTEENGAPLVIMLDGCAIMMPYLLIDEIVYIREAQHPCILDFLTQGRIPGMPIAKMSMRTPVRLHRVTHSRAISKEERAALDNAAKPLTKKGERKGKSGEGDKERLDVDRLDMLMNIVKNDKQTSEDAKPYRDHINNTAGAKAPYGE